MGLLSIFIFVLIDIFVGGINLQLESEATASTQEDGQYILARLIYDIQNADSITTPASSGTSSNTLSFVSSGITYTYTLTNGNLTLTRSGDTSNLNSLDTTITSINFTRLGNATKPTIQVQYTIKSVASSPTGQPETRNFQTTVGLR